MRTRSLLLLPAVLALAGFAPAPASTPITVNSISCYVYPSGGYYLCTASVSGGTGTYNSYDWTLDEYYGGSYAGTRNEWTYVEEVQGNCTPGTFVQLTLKVRDSNWDTGTGNTAFYCSY